MEVTAGTKRRARKARYKVKFESLIHDYKNVMIIGVDNVGSNQLQKIRIALRGKAIVIMGKNTLMRKLIRDNLERNPKLEALLPYVIGNMGLVFTNEEMSSLRSVITSFKVPAAAKTGVTAPDDVFVPPGPTGLDPGQTAFFQALNIATKIARGAIEIINEVHLIKKGDKVTSSAVALLAKLDIKPFFYGVTVIGVYEDGSIFPVSILDITPDDILQKFLNGVGQLTALSLATGWPSQLTLPHYFANGFKKLLALSLAGVYSFKEADDFSKKAASAPKVAAAPAAAKGGKDEGGKGGKDAAKGGKEDKKKKEEEKPKEEEEEDAGVGMGGLFD
jgi:large subunit ribosomal protein LP0